MSPICRNLSDTTFYPPGSTYSNNGISIVYHFNHPGPGLQEPVGAWMDSAYSSGFQFEEVSFTIIELNVIVSCVPNKQPFCSCSLMPSQSLTLLARIRPATTRNRSKGKHLPTGQQRNLRLPFTGDMVPRIMPYDFPVPELPMMAKGRLQEMTSSRRVVPLKSPLNLPHQRLITPRHSPDIPLSYSSS